MPGFIVRVLATTNRTSEAESDRQFRDQARFDTIGAAKTWIDTLFQSARGRARIAGIDIHLRVVADADYTQEFKDRFDAEGA